MLRLTLFFLAHLLAILLLMLVTQVGGMVYLVALVVKRFLPEGKTRWLVFPSLYFVFWLVIPTLAKPLGRVPLPYFASKEVPLQAQHWFTVLANRHYVRPELRAAASEVAILFEQKHNGTPLTYLDANFPFWDDFPLLPHRSHSDGRKLDLAFIYDYKDQLRSEAPGFLGYGRFTAPDNKERNQATICAKQGYWQYSFLGPLARPFASKKYTINQKASAEMVRLFARQRNMGKLLLEPHLKKRWGLGAFNKIRFQGCAAVRHDDHLHVQL